MWLDENGETIELDYEGMHEQLAKGKRGYKEHLNKVMVSSTALETAVKLLCEARIDQLIYPNLEKWKKYHSNPRVFISDRLKKLKSHDIIDEGLFEILLTLFKIRNKFAHELVINPKDILVEFDLLKKVNIDNKFVENLPNDSVKFQLVMSYCCNELFHIQEKLAPESILRVKSAGEFIPFEE